MKSNFGILNWSQILTPPGDDVMCNDITMMSSLHLRQCLSVCHVKTLKMSEDVLCVRHSPDGRLLAVALLDTTVKIFFVDTLKVLTSIARPPFAEVTSASILQFFLSLYGHKLPVLSMDISSVSSVYGAR